jgi:hypothetical protein
MGVICSSLRGSRESKYPLVTTLGGMREAWEQGAIEARSMGKSGVAKRKWAKAACER